MPLKVGSPEFASELVKIIDSRYERHDQNDRVRRGIGVVDTIDMATNTVSVFLYGSGFPSSGGFRTRSGIVPSAGDAVAWTIDGQSRYIEGILTGDSLPGVITNPGEGWTDYGDVTNTPSNPPTGYIRFYNKNGVTYKLDEFGNESEVGGIGDIGDGLDPGQVTNLTITPITETQSDGSIIPGFNVDWDAISPDPGDLAAYEVQWDNRTGGEEGGLGDPATWTTFYSRTVGVDVTNVTVTEGIIGGIPYDFRVRAWDIEGKVGTWSALASDHAEGDSDAPATPTSLNLIPGYKMFGATWVPNSEIDFSHYEIYYEQNGDSGTAQSFFTGQNAAVVTGLEEDVLYDVKLRAIDFSGNTSAWTSVSQVTPTLIGQEDVVFDQAIVNDLIATGTITASAITSGTLNIGGDGLGSSAAFIQVYDQDNPANLLLEVTDEGLLALDPQPNGDGSINAMLYSEGNLQFTSDYQAAGGTVWTTAINGAGISADAILFGTAPGGHNMVPNSGYELADWQTLLGKIWSVSTDWDDATATTNMVLTGTELTMGDYT